jgi:hypothetical protein
MTMPTPAAPLTDNGTSLARRYGEELLAYMMQVVLGQAGDPDRRSAWSSRGLDQGLDLERITAVMSDPGGNKTPLMVNDPNILGLSKVLYHYAPEMSQFSGSYATSLYPAAELVALRLFLLKRLEDNRQVSIQALLKHRTLLRDPRQIPTRTDLTAMNLTLEETRFLQAVFAAKPWLFESLTSPFLVAAFDRTGVLARDPLTARLIGRAHYRNTTCTPMGVPRNQNALVIAFLPSMTREFNPGDAGFQPTEAYLAAVDSLKRGILAACRHSAAQARGHTAPVAAADDLQVDALVEKNISFRALTTRPLVIYPENAAKVVRETCPEADFVVILLGRNVYQAVHIDPGADVFPAVNRIYLDITDVKHSQVSSEVGDIGHFVYERLKTKLAAAQP